MPSLPISLTSKLASQSIGRHQGNEASGREVNVRNEFSGAVKHLGKNELDWFAICEQLFAILAGQGGQ